MSLARRLARLNQALEEWDRGGIRYLFGMVAVQDLQSEGFRRLLVNAGYWALGMEAQIPDRAKVDLVGEYKPSPFKFNGARKGVKPADLK